ncbi:MAG: hypothetical protein KatS3mg124_1369 [Porticoccaceae bacterium]|nr:MAG: hypothetical protein KatS3mg124_1369 [Porticoccaceae bacterium]
MEGWPEALLAAVLAAACGGLAAVLFAPEGLPPFFAPGTGLTPLKVGFEYALAAAFALAAVLYSRELGRPRTRPSAGLAAACLLFAASELPFTLYRQVDELWALLGHVYKALGALFLYEALFVAAVREPHLRRARSEARLSALVAALPDPLLELDAQGHLRAIHGAKASHFPVPLDQLLGRPPEALLPPQAAAQVRAALERARRVGVEHIPPLALAGPQGEEWFEVSLARLSADGGAGYLALVRRRTAEVAARRTVEMLSTALRESPVGVVLTDEAGRVRYVNEAYLGLTRGTREALLGRAFDWGGAAPERIAEAGRALAAGEIFRGEMAGRRSDGSRFWQRVLAFPVRDEEGRLISIASYHEDISAERAREAKIRELLRTDPLTGLLNRQSLAERFAPLRARAEAQGAMLAVVSLDVDDFRRINESLGHGAGDDLLVELATALLAGLEPEEAAARLGGDNFALLFLAADQRSLAGRLAGLLARASLSRTLAGRRLTVTCSAGVACYPRDGGEFEALLRRSDAALYAAKQTGRGRARLYTAELSERVDRALLLVEELRRALRERAFTLVFQPQFDLRCGRLVAAEVLLRWHSPELGPVSPAEFIPLAEQAGLAGELDAVVLELAARQVRAWRAEGLVVPTLAVNLSPRHFEDPASAERLLAALRAGGGEPTQFELEVTEEVALADLEAAAETARRLRQAGFRLAVDDFGKGYSSLAYLQRLAVGKLKIDRAFVRELDGADGANRAIVDAVVRMAEALGMTTVAEGIERPGELLLLRRLGCHLGQGFLLCPPLPARPSAALLAELGGTRAAARPA